MKLKYILLLFFYFFTIIFWDLFAQSYDQQIQSLQKQINELNKKVESNYKENNKNIPKSLDDLKINGRVHVNGSWYNENNELRTTNKTSSYKDKFLVRRARFTVRKEISDFLFQFEGNFNNDKVRLGSTFIGYNINENMILKVGQILIPSFMEKEKSSNTMATIDFNAVEQSNWTPEYLVGINYIWRTNKFGLYSGIFGNGTNKENELENDMNYSMLSRVFYTPIKDYNYTIHLGLDLSYENYRKDFKNNQNQISDSYYYGIELAFKYKIIALTNEYIRMYRKYMSDRFNGNKFNFDGLSTEFTINFTGERTKYESSGCFGGIDVIDPLSKGGFGALQGVLRYSFANGKDVKNNFLNNIGSRYDYTIGLTWIPENNVRLLVNYSINSITGENYSFKGKYNAFKVELRMFF